MDLTVSVDTNQLINIYESMVAEVSGIPSVKQVDEEKSYNDSNNNSNMVSYLQQLVVDMYINARDNTDYGFEVMRDYWTDFGLMLDQKHIEAMGLDGLV